MTTPWIFAEWDHTELMEVAAALQTLNPLDYKDPEQRASHIRNVTETYLNRMDVPGPMSCGTGGWVVHITQQDDGPLVASVYVCGYTVARWLADLKTVIPSIVCEYETRKFEDGREYEMIKCG